MGRKASDIGTQHIQLPLDARLVNLASRQHGVVSLEQLRELGLSASGVRGRVEVARLHTVHWAVYSLVPLPLLARDGRFMAAVLACGPDAALSHRSAAALHELRRTDRANIDVTIPQRSPREHAGIDIHRSTTLTPADVTVVHAIPCTTVARTLLDLAQVIRRRQLERALDQAEILQQLDLNALSDQIERNKRRPAAKLLRAILDEHYIGSTPTWSELEEVLLAACRGAGLPIPEVDALIDPGDGGPPIRVDFVWRDARVIVETDGHRTHSTRHAFEEDRLRDQRLMVAGWTVIRVTWRQLTQRANEVTERIASLLRRR